MRPTDTRTNERPSPRRLLRAWQVLLVVFVAAIARPTVAQQSYFRLYDQAVGLNVGEIAALAQDDTGFVWIGAHRGLVRFDGQTFTGWAPARVDELVNRLAVASDGTLFVGSARGRLWRRVGSDLVAVDGPSQAPVEQLEALAADRHGRLWTVLAGVLWQRDADGGWQQPVTSIPRSERPRHLYAAGDAIVVLTDQAAWRIDAAGSVPVLRQPDLWAATGDVHTLWLTTHFAHVWRVDGAASREVDIGGRGRVLDLRQRGDSAWLALDTDLVALGVDGSVRRIGGSAGLPSGGPLLVDRENSLWLGSFVGLVQFPEPDTLQWSQAQGLPSMHTHAITPADGAFWISSWSGQLTRIDATTRALGTVATPFAAGAVCATAADDLWGIGDGALRRWNGTAFVAALALPADAELHHCEAEGERDGWITSSAGVLRVTHGEPAMWLPTTAQDDVDLAWRDGDAMVLAFEDRLCRVDVAAEPPVRASDCVALGRAIGWHSHAHAGPHREWLAANEGIFEFDGHALRRLAANHLIEGGIAQHLKPAHGGGWWVAGAGVLLRVQDCGACAEDWRVTEAPGTWQGLPGNAALDVVESGTGDLWLSGNRGTWRVPAAARALPTRAPEVVFVGAQVDAQQREPDQALTLQPQEHRLELAFAALSYRDRSLLRYRSRIGDEPWSAPTRESRLQLAALEPGDYRADVAASLDGLHWSAQPASVTFAVLPPWYRTTLARLVFALAAIALAVYLYRLRVAALLRVESERTRIAMDLHDEIGAGLGSIGMLAGAAAHGDAGERARIVDEIAHVAAFLGSGLRSLVWSLRSGHAGLAELGEQIADHARRLFPGEVPHLHLRLPGADESLALPAEVRRHALLVALEAMHNASRHAQAQHVDIALERSGEAGFVLRIEDDGCGFAPDTARGGTGLASMRRRARAIAADLRIEGTRGTRVLLAFRAAAQAAA